MLMVILPRRFQSAVDLAGNFRQHGGVLRLAGLEDFRDAGQTAGDVLRAGDFTRLAGEHVAGLNLLAVGDFDTGLGRQIVEVEDLAIGAFNGDTRMTFALVLDDDELVSAAAALAFFFDTGGFAFFDVLVADGAALLGQDRRDMRIPDDQLLARLDLFAVADQHGASRRAPCTFRVRGPWHP